MEQTYSVEEIREFEGFMRDPGRRAAFSTLKRRYDRVFSAVFATPWAILDSYMEVIATVLVEHVSGRVPVAEEIDARLAGRDRRPPAESERGVAVVPIHGALIPKASAFSESSGATSLESIRANFRAAMAEPRVSAIVLDVDSPGGSALGIPELAGEIRAARSRKPIVAAISGIGASGAYWLASQADEVVVTPSGLVGSIGVVSAHEDLSAAAASKGVKVTLISAGKYKTEGNPTEPLSDEARAHVQSMVDEFYGMFVADVARGRRVPVDDVRSGYGEGRVVNARTGVSSNLVDRIATVEDVVGELLSSATASAPPAAALGSVTTAAGGNVGAVLEVSAPTLGFVEVDDEISEIEVETETEEPDELSEALAFLEEPAFETAWDGNAAMGRCSTAADYRSICAGERTVGDPDERQHWALPHHDRPGAGPNPDGVRAARSRFPQTENLKNREAARRHLFETHRLPSDVSSEGESPSLEAIETELELLSVPISTKTTE